MIATPRKDAFSGAFLLTFIALCLGAATARAEWRVGSVQSEFSPGRSVEHRHLVLTSDASGEATLDLALFTKDGVNLRVLDNAKGDDNLAEAMKREGFIAGVNGGYFDPAFAPIGLRVIDGVVAKPLVRARLLTGLLCASRERGIELMRLGEYSKKRKYDAAIECGPFVVDLGAPVRGLNNARSARRTFVAVARSGKTALGYCDDATLAQLGDILASKSIEGFEVWRAMNFDGGSSSAFWFRRADGTALSIGEYKSVRDFVGVTAR